MTSLIILESESKEEFDKLKEAINNALRPIGTFDKVEIKNKRIWEVG